MGGGHVTNGRDRDRARVFRRCLPLQVRLVGEQGETHCDNNILMTSSIRSFIFFPPFSPFVFFTVFPVDSTSAHAHIHAAPLSRESFEKRPRAKKIIKREKKKTTKKKIHDLT